LVVLCERCRTRFQVESTRIPAHGIRVRCSRCKHAFFLRPGADAGRTDPPGMLDEATHQVAGSGADTGAAGRGLELVGADPATDGETADPRAETRSGGALELDAESDWEFNTDFPEAERSDSAGPEAFSDAADASEAGPGTPSFEDVGDPESWDLLAEEDEESEVPAPPLASSEATAPEPEPAAAMEAERGAAPDRRAAPGEAAASRGLAGRGPSLGELVGWLATALLLVIAAHGSLRVAAQPSVVHDELALGAGLQLEEVRGRWVENALGGSLYLVSGRVRNAAEAPRKLGSVLMVSLLRQSGAAIAGLRAPAGRMLESRRLRQEDPEQLKDELGRSALALALRPLAPGQMLEFDALFEALPPDAAGFRLELAPLPPGGSAAAGRETLEPPALPSAERLRSPTTSSFPRSAPPASE
jgi:predicted Zn finger-like uncharacterized protein